MADEADLAGDFQESFLQDCLQRQRRTTSDIPHAKGECLYCSEKLAPAKRWCDADCRDDWEREENARRRQKGTAPVSMLIAEIDD